MGIRLCAHYLPESIEREINDKQRKKKGGGEKTKNFRRSFLPAKLDSTVNLWSHSLVLRLKPSGFCPREGSTLVLTDMSLAYIQMKINGNNKTNTQGKEIVFN